MTKSADDDQSKWDQVMDHFDLLFNRMTDMGIVQQEMKTQIELNNAKVDKCSVDQQFIAQQVRANGQAVAQLTLRHFEEENRSISHSSSSLVHEDEEEHFQNMFAKDKSIKKPEQSKYHRSKMEHDKGEGVPHHALPKMFFPSLMAVIQKYGLTVAAIISLSIMCLRDFGCLLPQCI